MPAARAPEHPANLLGALSLVVVDRMAEALAAASGHSDQAATALSALHHFLDRPSIDQLRRVLGLTSSGTVRLVDRLEQTGLVTRQSGADGRATHVTLTPAGRRVARRVSGARSELLTRAVAVLSASEQATFDELLSRVLVGFMRAPGAVRWMCRLCDMSACGRADGACPVANEAAARYGPLPGVPPATRSADREPPAGPAGPVGPAGPDRPDRTDRPVGWDPGPADSRT